jgi:hypothetical protein
MTYLILIIVFIVITSIISKRTFYWETVIKYLWKYVYSKADKMAYWISESINKKESKEDFDALVGDFKNDLSIPGNLINAILDWVNKVKKERDEDVEEETFGYGRFDFDKILHVAKTNSEAFKKLK